MSIRPIWFLAIALAAAPPLPAADRAANLNDDIRFAQDLARYRLFDLAVSWLADIEQEGGLNPDNLIEVSLAKAKVSELAALNALTREARMRYFDESVQHYQAALEKLGRTTTVRKIEATVEGYARVLIDKGQFYVDEMTRLRSEGAPDDQLAHARAKAEEAFREAVKTLNSVYADTTAEVEDNEELPPSEANRLRSLGLYSLYRKGEAYYFWATLYEPQDFNREDYLNKCIESLTDYLWEAGEDEIVLTCLTYYYQGMASWELGKINADEAISWDSKAVAQFQPIHGPFGLKPELMVNLEENELRYVLGVLERGIRGQAQVYRHAANRFEEATNLDADADFNSIAFGYGIIKSKDDPRPWQVEGPIADATQLVTALREAAVGIVSELEDKVSRVGLSLTEEGERARLEKARALIDLGRVSEALAIVTDVAEKNENTMVGLEANELLATVIEQTDASAQPPSVWWLACEGHFAEERWLEAIDAAHRTIAACRTDAEKNEFACQAWRRIGDCYQRLGRNLETAMAYAAGLELATQLGNDSARDELALECYNAWNRRFKETKDPFDERERNKARDTVTRLGISGDVQFLVANEAFTNASAIENEADRKAAFRKAVDEFKAVPESSVYYERAMVFIGRCHAEAGDDAAAIAAWDALAKRAEDPTKAVGLDKKKSQQRSIALAEATFYKAQLLQDRKRWQEALDTLADYESTHSSQTNFFPPVNYYRVKALVGLNRVDEAEAILKTMQKEYAKSPFTLYATNVVANGHYAAYEALPEDRRKSAEALAHLRSAAEYLDAYNQARGYDSFTNVQLVADWYKILGESRPEDDPERSALLRTAALHYKRLLDRFGKDPARQRAIRDEVKPAYAVVLLELREFPDALPLWREIYARKPTNRDVVMNLARCLGGWLGEQTDRFGRTEYEFIPGTGNHTEAVEILVKLRQGIEAADEKYSPAWWDVNVLTLYNVVMWAKTDARMKTQGQRLITNWKNLMPDLGGDPYARRLRFLEQELNR